MDAHLCQNENAGILDNVTALTFDLEQLIPNYGKVWFARPIDSATSLAEKISACSCILEIQILLNRNRCTARPKHIQFTARNKFLALNVSITKKKKKRLHDQVSIPEGDAINTSRKDGQIPANDFHGHQKT